MLTFVEFKERHLESYNPFRDGPTDPDVLLATYAKYIINNLDNECYRVHCDFNNKDEVKLDQMIIDVGVFSPTYCCDLLETDDIFVADHEELDYVMVGAEGGSGVYNRLGTYIWGGFYEGVELVYGDILLVRKDKFGKW